MVRVCSAPAVCAATWTYVKTGSSQLVHISTENRSEDNCFFIVCRLRLDPCDAKREENYVHVNQNDEVAESNVRRMDRSMFGTQRISDCEHRIIKMYTWIRQCDICKPCDDSDAGDHATTICDFPEFFSLFFWHTNYKYLWFIHKMRPKPIAVASIDVTPKLKMVPQSINGSPNESNKSNSNFVTLALNYSLESFSGTQPLARTRNGWLWSYIFFLSVLVHFNQN